MPGAPIVFDVVNRYLRFKGLRVTFVKNFTDVDDKIIKRAKDEGLPATGVSERYIAEYQADMASIGVLPPDIEPKATEHIPEMVALIERLIVNGVAYVVDGDVYFEVRRFPAYGALSGKNIEDLEAGARVDVDERKRDPLDFALWKAAKPGEPSWPSPWGPGRPGWHIECSAMAMRYLGESFDLHGGGEDLIFPHHENEIAQSEAATARPFVRSWLHNGFVNLGSEKMSKSLGNTLTIRDMVRRHDPEAIRLYLLGTHYRHPLEFSDERIAEAARALGRLSALKAEAERIAAKGTATRGSGRRALRGGRGPSRPVRGGHGRRLQYPAGARCALRPGQGSEHGPRPGDARHGGSRRLPAGRGRALERWRVCWACSRAPPRSEPVDARAQGAGRIPGPSAPGGQKAARLCRGRPPSRRAHRAGRPHGGHARRNHLEAQVREPDPPLIGRHPVLELLRADSRRVEEIAIIAEGRGPALQELLTLAKSRGVKISFRTREQLTSMAGTPHHQGVVARAAGASYWTFADLLDVPAARGEPAFFLGLDQVQDPRNLGAILRSAEATGVHGVVVPKHNSAGLTGGATKSAVGAVGARPGCPGRRISSSVSRP